MKNAQLLDCTLRDGAYLVDKKFGDNVIHGIVDGLVKAGIECIEIGFLQDEGYGEGKTVYRNNEDAKKFIPKNKNGCIFTVLTDYGKFSMENLELCDPESIDGIRECFKKDERYAALEACKKIKEKGYKLFVQPVGILGYSDEELIELIKLINEIEPYSFSIVDTFGSMYQEDLHRVFQIINHNLNPSCKIGFHSHNNMQLSNALSQEFVRMTIGIRDIIIDGTISGMGRGAGNTPIELIAQYLNTRWHYNYDMDVILDLIDNYMDNIRTKCSWGYTTPYFIAGCYGTHVDNIQYLTNKNSISSKDIRYILDNLGSEYRKKYNPELLEKIYLECLKIKANNSFDLSILKSLLSNQNILIIAPGHSIVDEEDKIQKYISEVNPLIISVGFVPEHINPDYVYINNLKRYNNWKTQQSFKRIPKIITSNIKSNSNDENEYIINFSDIVKPSNEFGDNSTILLLRLLDILGVNSIALAGFDGYEYSTNNFANKELELSNPRENPIELNNSIAKMLLDYLLNRQNNTSIDFVTTSKFSQVIDFYKNKTNSRSI